MVTYLVSHQPPPTAVVVRVRESRSRSRHGSLLTYLVQNSNPTACPCPTYQSCSWVRTNAAAVLMYVTSSVFGITTSPQEVRPKVQRPRDNTEGARGSYPMRLKFQVSWGAIPGTGSKLSTLNQAPSLVATA